MNRSNMPMQMQGRMKKKMMSGGGALKMVTNKQGKKVPFYAADGVGKMSGGGKVKGGKPKGCGIAKKGVKNATMVTMKGS